MPRIPPIAPLLLCLLVSCQSDDDGGSSPPVPDSGHLSLDGTGKLLRGPYLQSVGPRTVTISWSTDVNSTSRVKYWAEPGDAREVFGRTFIPEPTTDNALMAGTLPETFQHEVVLTSLEPGRSYTYEVLSVPEPKPTATFRAPPDADGEYSFLMFGDTRTNGSDHCQVIDDMVPYVESGEHVAFVLHTGDMVETGGVEDEWNDFFEFEAPLLRRVPIIPVFGNHELFLGRTIFEGLFQKPSSSQGGTDRWYSVDVGNMHIAVLDAQSVSTEPQLDWLESDLAGTRADIKVVALHKPLYTYSNHAPDVKLRDELVPILEAHGVALVVSGHNHLYERFFGGGIHYVVSGGGGAPLYSAHSDPDADNTGAEVRAEQSVLHFVYGRRNGNEVRFEAISSPNQDVLDCWVIDVKRPGVELPCD